MKYVKKIYFRNSETYNRLYQGSELLFEVQKEVEWKGLTFTALEPSTIQYTKSTVSTAQYSYDAVNWETANNVTLNLNTGDKVYFKGNITGNQSTSSYANFSMTGKVEASGSIMSMQDGNPQDKSLKYEYEFACLFFDCTSLVTAPELPVTTLTKYCYFQMFDGTHIVNAPDLPATTLAHSCYELMFSGTHIVNAPALPATTLANYCYYGMFYGCPSIVTAPELPATTLADYCYSVMFAHSNLVNAPALPATTLANYCYYSMFNNCTSLVNAPELPATTLVEGCYDSMFRNCTSLVNAPELPATTLAHICYKLMFSGTHIVNAPALPATTLAVQCYYGMFSYCDKLVNAPELPATTLVEGCYESMFKNCTSLVNAPELPATTLADYCYRNMFNGCNNLNYIKCAAREYRSVCFAEWVANVAPTGDFYCYDSSIFPTGNSGIPTGWTVHNEGKQYDVLYVSGHYNFKIPKGDGTYYVIDTKNDCEADIITNKDFNSINSTIIGSANVGDRFEWELFFNNKTLYFDLSFKNKRRLSWTFGTITKDTVYTIGGSNGNYLGTDRALYVNGSKKASSTTLSTYNNTSDIINIGNDIYDFYLGNIKIYEKTGLVYHIVPIMYNGNVAFYDKVNKRFMEIKSTPPSEYAMTRATGEKIII